jgi:hypothetical protein
MKEYIGVDLKKRTATGIKKDRCGKVTGRATLPITQKTLRRYFYSRDDPNDAFLDTSLPCDIGAFVKTFPHHW